MYRQAASGEGGGQPGTRGSGLGLSHGQELTAAKSFSVPCLRQGFKCRDGTVLS